MINIELTGLMRAIQGVKASRLWASTAAIDRKNHFVLERPSVK